MKNMQNLIIVGSLTLTTLIGGITMSRLLPNGGAWSALVGSGAGVLASGAVLTSKIGNLKEKLRAVKGELIQTKDELDKVTWELKDINQKKLKTLQLQQQIEEFTLHKNALEGQINALTAQVENLEEQQRSLYHVEAQLISKQDQLESISTKLEELQAEAEKVRQNKDTNEEKLTQLQIEIQSLSLKKAELESNNVLAEKQLSEAKKQHQQKSEELQDTEAKTLSLEKYILELNGELAAKKPQLELMEQHCQELQEKSRQLEQKNAELELLRATYDSLFREKQLFEEKVNQLRPEIDRLEAEKQRILQAIQEHQGEYDRLQEVKQKLHNLTTIIRAKETELRAIERDIACLDGTKISLQKDVTQLKLHKDNLERELKQLKGEIDELENSSKVALRSLRENLWHNLAFQKWTLDRNEEQFIKDFGKYLQAKSFCFPPRVIRAFHTSLKVQDISALVVLAGISGTGKSELPQKYADFIGAQLITLPVQPRWDSPQDLQGFYNYVEKKFKPTDLMRALYQYNQDDRLKDRIVIVLLDEMNLARVEYYFSDFLSKLETRRNQDTYLEIDIGSLPIKDEQRRLKIPQEFLFVGTMNEDETTQTLSDKVLDRANVLTFGKPEQLHLRHHNNGHNGYHKLSGYLTYSDFLSWVRKPDANSELVSKVKEYINSINTVMEKMGHPFAHRVYQAIAQYVVNYPGVEGVDSEAFKWAIADQIGQKLLPKLRGVMIDDSREALSELKDIIREISDRSLIDAFDNACQGRYGQFYWQGLVYKRES